MIQLNKSAEDQLVAFYPDVEVSASVDTLYFDYVQDYDQSSGSFEAALLSKKQWLVASVSGSDVPANTGQYTLSIYELLQGTSQFWDTSIEVFDLSTTVWNEGTANLPGQLLAVERSYVSGSNGSSLTTYYSPNENGGYITYNS